MTSADDPTSAGSAYALVAWLRHVGMSHNELAGKLEPRPTRSAVWQWCHRRANPTETYRSQIQQLTDGAVDPDGWLPSESELRYAEGVLLRAATMLEQGEGVRYEVLARDGRVLRTFGNVVLGKRYLDESQEGARLVRTPDGVTLAYRVVRSAAETQYLAKLFAGVAR